MTGETRDERRETSARLRAALALVLCASLGARAVSAQAKVPLVLHHLVLSIDSTTWNEVVKSPFVTEQFAATQLSEYLNPPDAGPDGIRIMGKYNYVQLMASRSSGHTGVILATERGDGLTLLRGTGSFHVAPATSVRSHTTSRGVSVAEISDRIAPAGTDSMARVVFEIMQYTADAARMRYSTDSLPESNRSNARFLSEYFDGQKLLSHLSSATLAMPVQDIAKIVRVLERDGIAVTSQGEGATIKLDGVTLKLIAPYEGAGVKQLQFALTRTAVGNPIYKFGPRSQLRFGPGPIAVWDFK